MRKKTPRSIRQALRDGYKVDRLRVESEGGDSTVTASMIDGQYPKSKMRPFRLTRKAFLRLYPDIAVAFGIASPLEVRDCDGQN